MIFFPKISTSAMNVALQLSEIANFLFTFALLGSFLADPGPPEANTIVRSFRRSLSRGWTTRDGRRPGTCSVLPQPLNNKTSPPHLADRRGVWWWGFIIVSRHRQVYYLTPVYYSVAMVRPGLTPCKATRAAWGW